MEERDDLDDYVDELINAEYVKLIQGDIGQCTCQLFKKALDDTTTPFASGVFTFLGESFYLLTASHVIEDWSDSNKLFVKVGESFVSVVGKGCGTEIENSEKIDTAYIKLKQEIVKILVQHYRFLPFQKILHQRKIFNEPNFCAFGYPVINKRKQENKTETFGSAYFLKAANDKVFDYYNLKPLYHYVLEYSGKAINIKTNTHEKIRTEHYGLSGGGLWYIDIGFDEERGVLISEVTLIGILTEFRRSKYSCLIANRMEIVLASIYKNEEAKFES